MNNKLLLHSPVTEQDFIWMAAYMDGTYASEFSFDSRQENSFDSINRNSLIRFGLIGHGMNLYFEVYGGEFKLAGRLIEFFYKDRKTNKEYPLSGHGLTPYNNIHQFKNAESSLNLMTGGGDTSTTITQYNFGYGKQVSVDGVDFNLKTTCCVPYGENVYLNFELSSNTDFEHGVFVIRKNGVELFEIDAPMEMNNTYQLNWKVT